LLKPVTPENSTIPDKHAMRFEKPLIPAILVRRYKRFLADIEISGKVETVHCPNPGAMLGLDTPGSQIFVSRSGNPKRKLPKTLEIVIADDTPVGINTVLPNRLAEEALGSHMIDALDGYENLRREVRYGENSRIDFLLSDPNRRDCYVEIKNVHLSREKGLMEFPDCTTKRGAKHLGELAAQVAAGNRAVMLYVIQRGDGERFRLARDIDPAYGEAFDLARAAGVETIAWDCRVDETEIVLRRPVPVDE
jgi:sugar fermentation stimulation protein A